MFIVGNWKMNGSLKLCDDFIENIKINDNTEVVICAPLIYAHYISQKANFSVGAQDCSQFQNGSHTGDVSCKMMKEIGLKYAIIGHSERIRYHNELREISANKVIRCIENNIIPILCIDGKEEIVKQQISFFSNVIDNFDTHTIIAYEPSYCIGTGIVPANHEIHAILCKIKELGDFKTIYGGSVTRDNVVELMKISSLDGVLIGGASLSSEQCNQIIQIISA